MQITCGLYVQAIKKLYTIVPKMSESTHILHYGENPNGVPSDLVLDLVDKIHNDHASM